MICMTFQICTTLKIKKAKMWFLFMRPLKIFSQTAEHNSFKLHANIYLASVNKVCTIGGATYINGCITANKL